MGPGSQFGLVSSCTAKHLCSIGHKVAQALRIPSTPTGFLPVPDLVSYCKSYQAESLPALKEGGGAL